MADHDENYDSSFESDEEVKQKKKKRKDLALKDTRPAAPLPDKSVYREAYNAAEGRIQRFHFLSLTAYDRHKKLVNDYLLYYPGAASLLKRDASKDKTDHDVLLQNHKFLWDDDDTADTWEKRLAKKYYDKLFKEYCIADLIYYKQNKIAMRWRTEKEVLEGRGHFTCGNKRCDQKDYLRTWEVNFGYVEQGQKKNALVKLRLCPECSVMLNYHHQRKEVKKKTKKRKHGEEKREKGEKKKRRKSSKEEEEREERREEEKESQEEPQPESLGSIWSQPLDNSEKTRDEEFEEYLEDLFF